LIQNARPCSASRQLVGGFSTRTVIVVPVVMLAYRFAFPADSAGATRSPQVESQNVPLAAAQSSPPGSRQLRGNKAARSHQQFSPERRPERRASRHGGTEWPAWRLTGDALGEQAVRHCGVEQHGHDPPCRRSG
jgi:hypothetical protein